MVVLVVAVGWVRADSNSLIGIHFWGDRNDATPAQMLDSVNRGAWDLEIVNTANLQFGGWKDEDVVDPLYQNFKTTYNVTPVTRLGYYWGNTLPVPGTPEYANWAGYIASDVVGRMKNTAHLWQMGNEPNLHGEAQGWVNQQITPTDYATLYRQVRTAIHNASLQGTAGAHKLLVAPVSPGGVAGDRWMDGNAYLDQVLANIPAGEVDGVAIHAYGGGGAAWQGMVDFHKAIAGQMAVIDGRGLTGVPVYLTEWNRFSNLGDAGQEAITADFVRKAAAFLNRWNRTPGNHNVVGSNWFVYDGTGNGSGSWDGYSIEYWKSNGNPTGSAGDLYTAFQQVARAGYQSGVAGSRPVPASVRYVDDFETATGRFTAMSGTSSGMNGVFSVRQDDDSYTHAYSQKFGFASPSAATWYARVPTTTFARPIDNVAIPLTAGMDGYIGLFLRVYTVAGVQATDIANPVTDMQVALSMDVASDNSRTEQGQWRSIVADGEWHFYQWNLDDLADWTVWRDRTGNVLNNSTGVFPNVGNVWLDSVLLRGGNYAAEVLFDSIMINSAGTLSAMDYIPEPVALPLVVPGVLGLLRRRR